MALRTTSASWPVVSRYFPGLRDLSIYDRYGQNVKFLPPALPAEADSARGVAIVFSRWERDAKTSVASLNSFEALIRLKDSGFWVAPDRESIQQFLNWIESVPTYQMVYSDVDEAAAFVKDLLSE